jgi:hypothetical protein
LNSEEGSRTKSPSALLGKQYGVTIALGLSVGLSVGDRVGLAVGLAVGDRLDLGRDLRLLSNGTKT